jgi:Flp pilus assembly protein TadD/peroxiredoxin
MSGNGDEPSMFSRRNFLKSMQWAPLVFLPSPLRGLRFQSTLAGRENRNGLSFSPTDFRLKPNYAAKSPVEHFFQYLSPGTDEYLAEKYAYEIAQVLGGWSQALKKSPPAANAIAEFLDPSIAASGLKATQEALTHSDYGIEVFRRVFPGEIAPGRDRFLEDIRAYFSSLVRVETADFEIVRAEEISRSPLTVRVDIRYTLVGAGKDEFREQRIGNWITQWSRDPSNGWRVTKWQAPWEMVSRAREPLFTDVTAQALGGIPSYREQMLRGVDHWRTVLDGACGIDVYGNNGIAVGDFDNDGFDDIYICQPAGLPNRLYRNRGDGTFEDVTEKSGLNVLDATACALFADFENKGLQDLLVVCGSGPLLFLNEGNGKFSIKREAFQFEHPAQGTFTQAAIADYDRDGRLDIYFCLYSYYLGLDQYHYPAPYFDARNGPPNFLFHNEGNATFRDRTQAAGLNVDNDRYSFACAWGDHNSDGWPDLYVANDFGRNNLYRNNGDGTFTSVSREAGVEDVGAGMSVCWFDFDNDGKQDVYVADMWSAAGKRVSQQKEFQQKEPEAVRDLYRQHAAGNALYRNRGNGQFENVTSATGVDMGRWAWSSDAWDFDHDGWPDLYVANGYISGPDTRDLASFFWRHVVAKSPHDSIPSPPYEQGWNAINELIRSDLSWNGYERNVFYLNNRDGTFSDISGITGLDFPDDSRSFVVADLDADGRMEVVLKNRNAPQVRILRNAMKEIGSSIAFRLRGQKSNRDGIGAAVTLEAGGRRQTKYLQAGSGFLSQHSKEIFFGVGTIEGAVRATVRWPSGVTQIFDDLPINHRISVNENSNEFTAKPFSSESKLTLQTQSSAELGTMPSSETWLIQPLSAPGFALSDLAGKSWDLHSLRGSFVVVNFWTSPAQASHEQLKLLQRLQILPSKRLSIVSVNVDEQRDVSAVRSLAAQGGYTFPVLLGTEEVAGVYNILYRYLYDRHRDLPLPMSFLVDPGGMIVKLYQGIVAPDRVVHDLKFYSTVAADPIRAALPFPGTLFYGGVQRNDFSYGVALFQHGYLAQAAASFQQVIALKPDEPEAYYNLGTLYLRQNNLHNARFYLEKTVALRRNYPEAWNNLAMIDAHEGRTEAAIGNFEQSLRLRPDYATALVNLGNLYRRQAKTAEAEKLLAHALEIEPDNPEVNYALGMLYGEQGQMERAVPYFNQALAMRPDYSDALNNLGVLFVRARRFAEAEEKFKACISSAPQFDQGYLNLARLYIMLNDKEKAETVLHTLLLQQPQHKVAQQMLGMLR